jgi:hypothetical protein
MVETWSVFSPSESRESVASRGEATLASVGVVENAVHGR